MFRRAFAAGAIAVAVAGAVVPGQALAVGSTSGSVVIPASPLPTSGTIDVSGSGFAKRQTGATVQILMCSDPGGSSANLPKDNSGCDGTTLNPNTVVPTASGTFSDKYAIQPISPKTGFQITCDATHYCVLWVGEDYVNKFLGTPDEPVGFSAPFLVGAGGNVDPPASSGNSFPVAAVAIPVGLVAVGGGFLWWRRRRTVSPR